MTVLLVKRYFGTLNLRPLSSCNQLHTTGSQDHWCIFPVAWHSFTKIAKGTVTEKMTTLLSEETKKRLEVNLLSQLAFPVSLDAEPPQEASTRLFSDGEVCSFLYGKTRPQPVIKDVLNNQTASQAFNTDCDFCRTMPQGNCPMHKDPSQVLSETGLTYAVKSLPPACKLCVSSVGKGCGVYANQDIPLGTWIGPYEGRRIHPSDVTPYMDTSHMWEIYEGTTLSHYIDGSDENIASWMRFIRCARHKEEQNLFSFQYNGNIYYRAFKDIPCGTELLVWYDEQYPMYMGIPLGMEVGAGYVPTATTAAEPQHNRQQSATALQQSHRYLNTVSPPVKPQDEARYSNTPTRYRRPSSTSPPTSYQDSRSTVQSDLKGLPPLIPTRSLSKRPASVDSLPPNLWTQPNSEVETGTIDLSQTTVPNSSHPLSELTSWKCQQCHKIFTQRVALQMHVCQSQPTKPFQCGQCGSTFNNSSELRAHVVSHTTERPFKCGFCSRTFVGATTLNNHVRTHMGQKPFSCDKCGKAFSQAMHLARHICELAKDSSRIGSTTPRASTS